jgi:serine/threonine-protein kinase
MTPERHAQIKAAFLEVVDAPRDRWPELLRRECGGDTDLEREVASLLDEHLPGSPLVPRPEPPARSPRRRRALWSAAALAMLGVVLAVSIWSFSRLRASWADLVGEQLRGVLDATASALSGHLWRRLEEVARLAADPAIAVPALRMASIADTAREPRSAIAAAPDNRRLDDRLRAAMATLGATSYAIVSPRLLIASAADDVLRGGRLSAASSHKLSAAARAFEGAPRFSHPGPPFPGAGDPHTTRVWFAAPVRERGGRVGALVGIAFDAVRDFAALLQTGRFGATAESYAFDSDGLLLSNSRFEEQLHRTGVLPDGEPALARLRLQDPGGDITAGYQPALKERSAWPLTRLVGAAIEESRYVRPSGAYGVLSAPYRDYRGVEVLGAWRWLPEWELGIATEIDASEVYAPLGYLYVTAGVLVAVAAAAALGALVYSLALASARRRAAASPRLGPYTLLDKIGEGGIGEVYLARHDLLKRRTAIKLLKLSAAEPEMLARFEREVRATSRLTHANTVTVYDFGVTAEGRFYFAMEFVEGITLAKLIERAGRLPVSRALHLLAQVCASLREAHGIGLIHRDIKPLNIMVGRQGGEYDAVKVLDFGLVKDLGRAPEETLATTRVSGTPLYMAPERVRGELAVDARVDVYSVGAVAYKMLTGQNLFHSPSELGVLYDILHTEPRPLLGLVPDVPDSLERLVLRCVAKDPGDRPPTIDAVLHAMQEIAVAPWTKEDARRWWEERPELLAAPPWWS